MANETNVVDSIIQFYTYKNNTLMAPTLGAAVLVGNDVYAVSVAHTIQDRDSLEVWTGLHPNVSKSFRRKTNAAMIASVKLTSPNPGIVLNTNMDILAIPINGKMNTNLTPADKDITLLQPAFIAFLDYEPDKNDVLERKLDGIAGLVSRVTQTHFIVSATGCVGMSGAPVLIKSKNKLAIAGIYTGTPPQTPVTQQAVKNFANVVKIFDFLHNLKKKT